MFTLHVLFQNGPVAINGVNGLTNELLLALVAHRLACFQSGTFACIENETALKSTLAALDALEGRTKRPAAPVPAPQPDPRPVAADAVPAIAQKKNLKAGGK